MWNLHINTQGDGGGGEGGGCKALPDKETNLLVYMS